MEKWSWEKSNGEATDESTLLAYQVLTGHGLLINFYHLVWNDMVTFINKVRGKAWDESILTLAETKMTNSDKILTSARFNALYTLLNYSAWTWKTDSTKEGYVGDRLFYGVNDNKIPDLVYGYYFLELINVANSMIKN